MFEERFNAKRSIMLPATDTVDLAMPPLQAALEKDKLDFDSEKWILARYNDPSTKPAARKNEVLIPLRSFDIWQD